MKPIEIELKREQQKIFNEDNFSGYTTSVKTYKIYRKEDCVIAYRKCFLGVVMLLQGKKSMFGFIILNNYISRLGWGDVPELLRKDLKLIRMLFNYKNDYDKLFIINDEKYKIFERTVLYEAING